MKLEEIVSQLKGIRCPSSIWHNGTLILSCSDAIATALSRFLKNGGDAKVSPEIPVISLPREDSGSDVIVGKRLKGEMAGICPECSGVLEHAEGCVVCRMCGFSRCG